MLNEHVQVSKSVWKYPKELLQLYCIVVVVFFPLKVLQCTEIKRKSIHPEVQP